VFIQIVLCKKLEALRSKMFAGKDRGEKKDQMKQLNRLLVLCFLE
jgi:hypothetical protein